MESHPPNAPSVLASSGKQPIPTRPATNRGAEEEGHQLGEQPSSVGSPPPFCPTTGCCHHQRPQLRNWYIKWGYTTSRLWGRIQRYRCRECRKTFSDRTFAADYRVKRNLGLADVFRMVPVGLSVRGMARSLHADTDAIINRLRRLARQCLAAHADLRQNCTLNESLAADGVRAFTGSQFFPCDVTVLAGRDSRYLYGFDYALLRRSGRMTRKQRAHRERIEREVVFDPNATQLSFSRVLDLLVRIPFKRGRGRVLWTDKHHAYVRAWERHSHVQNMQERELLRHSRVSSFAPRTRSNPLFVVNYFEREIRKDRADHHRETVCFARNVCDMLGRLAIYMLHHNVLKPFHVTGSATPSPSAAVAQSHATVAGIPPEEQCAALERLLTQRRFLSRVSLSPSEELLWVRGFPTPLAGRAEYVPKYALA